MAHELNLDDVFIESGSGQQQRQQQTNIHNFDSQLAFDAMNSNSMNMTARENISVNEESTTHNLCFIHSRAYPYHTELTS
ncbi:hypothetical protein AM593_02932, partial [Mytilus galloprovincialis]